MWLLKDGIMIDFKVPEFPERIMKRSLKNDKRDPSWSILGLKRPSSRKSQKNSALRTSHLFAKKVTTLPNNSQIATILPMSFHYCTIFSDFVRMFLVPKAPLKNPYRNPVNQKTVCLHGCAGHILNLHNSNISYAYPKHSMYGVFATIYPLKLPSRVCT